ncbi:hypothetical protein [Streptomyces sp. NRRL F-2664]|uniref:hypothetical protein n=1 Tax=Streptomyces sp. NRRL F-2664 TaxID=1463842 RepID=UPI00131BA82D|nr:hypothetical protein [Streptomyces sp. NRRL F-2664]
MLHYPRWQHYLQINPGPCLLDTLVTATLGGQPWQEPFEFASFPTLFKHLVTACFIVLAYLTGMRSAEVLVLESGCCPEPEGPQDGVQKHLIYGRQFKGAKDEDGNHLSAGVIREAPWVANPQVVTAVRALKRFVGDDEMLFAAVKHDARTVNVREGRSLSLATISNRVEGFIDWVNDYAESRGWDSETIPADDLGRVGIARFRRTLAWHIARQPGGLVALAVQYGHVRTLVSEGYGARSRGGIHDLMDFETARSVAEHLSDVHEALQDGYGVSGPATRRLIHSAAQEHERFGGIVTPSGRPAACWRIRR